MHIVHKCYDFMQSETPGDPAKHQLYRTKFIKIYLYVMQNSHYQPHPS